ncbi:ribonuclease P protein subunit p29 [Ostrinia furnacalis]|uniref:ribonuclease P protein subunit p29 n=1 Tax=Ostrinia furnacalis TaxID=93504 RepID=UPI00104036F6|nr:ribonuclease P protein subunit p29 [Ostrinia furnacalis]
MSSEENVDREAIQAIVNFVKSNVPRSDVPNVEAELKKDFVLAKRRSRTRKQKAKKKKVKNLTRKEKKSLGFYSIPRDSVKYADVQPMNDIWLEYISNMLELDKEVPQMCSKGWETFSQTIYKADFHGSMLEVARSKCPSYVGKKGICIMDTRNTFKIVSTDNTVTTIPKRDSVFDIYMKKIKVTIFGKHICVRPAERSSKKFKSLLFPDL